MWCDDLWTLQLASDENFSASYPIPSAPLFFGPKRQFQSTLTLADSVLVLPPWDHGDHPDSWVFPRFLPSFFSQKWGTVMFSKSGLTLSCWSQSWWKTLKKHACFRSINHAWLETVLEVVNHCLQKKLASFCFDIFRFYFCDWYSHKESQTTPNRVYGWISWISKVFNLEIIKNLLNQHN